MRRYCLMYAVIWCINLSIILKFRMTQWSGHFNRMKECNEEASWRMVTWKMGLGKVRYKLREWGSGLLQTADDLGTLSVRFTPNIHYIFGFLLLLLFLNIIMWYKRALELVTYAQIANGVFPYVINDAFSLSRLCSVLWKDDKWMGKGLERKR